MARSNSPRAHVRRHFVTVMKSLKDHSTELMSLWHSRSTIFEAYEDETGRRNGRQVPRPAHDFPENQPIFYSHAITRIDDMIEGLTILRQQMIAEQCALRDGKPSPMAQG